VCFEMTTKIARHILIEEYLHRTDLVS
jgi:hypothetical protein